MSDDSRGTSVDLGVVGTTAEAISAITNELADFMRAGGTFSWFEWGDMHGITKDTAVAAGTIVALERAEMLVTAIVDRLNEGDRSDRAESLLDAAAGLL